MHGPATGPLPNFGLLHSVNSIDLNSIAPSTARVGNMFKYE